jgi:hypothetical protein
MVQKVPNGVVNPEASDMLSETLSVLIICLAEGFTSSFVQSKPDRTESNGLILVGLTPTRGLDRRLENLWHRFAKFALPVLIGSMTGRWARRFLENDMMDEVWYVWALDIFK